MNVRSETRTSGRIPTFTEEARRAQLLAAAIETVNEVGYQRASLAAIGERANVAKSAIAYYFDSKDALLLSIVDGAFSALGDALTAILPQLEGPAARLEAYAETYLTHVDQHRAAVAAAAEIVVSHRRPDGVPLYLVQQTDESALLREILAEGMHARSFRPMPLDVAVEIAESILDRSITLVQRDLGADIAEYRATAVPVLLAAFGVEPDA